MGLLGYISNFLGKTVESIDDYETSTYGTIEKALKLKDTNAYVLANAIPELYFPIDFYADRVSKLNFYVADKKGERVKSLDRLITNINPIHSFSELVYDYVFNLLADGNSVVYSQFPKTFSQIKSTNSLSRVDVLNPLMIDVYERNNLSDVFIESKNEFINSFRYYNNAQQCKELERDNIFVTNNGGIKKQNSILFTRSQLFKAEKAVNNLLSVYSARYNVYANNGMAGILTKKSPPAGSDMAAIGIKGNQRDNILKDLNKRYGLTGKRNIWGVTGADVKFINTLASIKELMPLEETQELTIKIASVFQIPSELVPRKDHSTYSNQDASEQSVWNNSIIPMTNIVCDNFSKIFKLENGMRLVADYSNVSALKINEEKREEVVAKRIANLEKLKELSPGKEKEIQIEIDNIIQAYGN